MGDRTKIQIRLLELEARKQELAQIASGKSIDQGKRKKEKGKDMLQGKEDIALSQAIAFAESLLEQAAAIKTQS